VTDVLATPATQDVCGIAKKISLELEHLPLHTHAAIINIVNTMCQHRKIVLESEMQQKQMEAQEAAMADARRAHAQAQVARDMQIATQIGREVQQPPDEPKKPRLSLVLNEHGKLAEEPKV
jgi:hypothetical protein